MPELVQEGLSYSGGVKNRKELQDLHLQAETALKNILTHPEYQNLDARVLRDIQRIEKAMPETRGKLWNENLVWAETDGVRFRMALDMKLLALRGFLSILNRDAEGKNTQ